MTIKASLSGPPCHYRSPGRTAVTAQGERLYFGGSSYLGLHRDSRVLAALAGGLARWGLGIGASRVTTGETRPYLDLEKELVSWTGAKDALLTASGWMANLCAAEILVARYPVALVDADAHPSLRRALAAFGRRPVLFSFSKGMDALRKQVRTRAARARRPILLCAQAASGATGQLTDLAALSRIADESGCGLWIDDALGFGLLGRDGRGSLDHFGLTYRKACVTTSFGKALGCAGGAVLLPWRAAATRLISTHVTATPIPPALCLAIRAAIERTRKHPALRSKVLRLGNHFKEGLGRLGIEVGQTPIPIAVFSLGGRRDYALASFAFDEGIVLPLIRYPGGKSEVFFRVTVNALHTRRDVDHVLEIISRFIARKEFA